MHTLHTTKAFVLQSYPHGESNKTYKLLTREKRLLYAHGQGVRELKSKNRYALQTGCLLEVTLVRGREVWRITGARDPIAATSQESVVYKRKILHLIGNMLAVEDPVEEVFDVLSEGYRAFSEFSDSKVPLVEVVTLVRLMDKLGFVARPVTEPALEMFLGTSQISESILNAALEHRRMLVLRINSALEEAK